MSKCKICGNEFTGNFCNMCGTPLQNVEENIIGNREENVNQQCEIYNEELLKETLREIWKSNMQEYNNTIEKDTASDIKSVGFDNRMIIKWILYGLNWIFLVVMVGLLVFGKAMYPSEENYRENYIDYKYEGYTSRMDAGVSLWSLTENMLKLRENSESSDIVLFGEVLVFVGIIYMGVTVWYMITLVQCSRANNQCKTFAVFGRVFSVITAVISVFTFVGVYILNEEYGGSDKNVVITPMIVAVFIMAIIKFTILIPQYVKVFNKKI